MSDLLRAQVVLQHVNGLPRDAVNMNFWFAPSVGATEAIAHTTATRVVNFFNRTVAPRPAPLAQQLAAQIATNGHHVKMYDVDEVTGDRLSFDGAPPIWDEPFNLAGPRNNYTPMPSEVACCLSFKSNTGGTPGGGIWNAPAAQKRGRVYFGPLGSGALDSPAGSVARPGTDVIDPLLATASMMMLEAANDDTPWIVYSRPFAGRGEVVRPGRRTLPAMPAREGRAYVIDTVWCDDAWDTQRRRGERPTTRTFG